MNTLMLTLMVLLIGFTYFAWAKGILQKVQRCTDDKPNFSSFLLWTFLDGVLLANTLLAKQDPTLILCYTIPTAIIFGILVYKKQFGWSRYDTIVTLLVLVCIIVSFVYKDNPTTSVVVTAIALFFAGIPNIGKLANDEDIPAFRIGVLFITVSFIQMIKIWFINGQLIELIFPSTTILYWFIIIVAEDLIKENDQIEEDDYNQFFE